jgi:hypothetical protein
MPGRSKDEPDYPDYHLIQVSVSQDKAFFEQGLKNVSILVCWCEQTCVDFYLGYLCMLEYSSVQHIFRLVYPVLPVSLACPLRYSLTFTYT